ncbi:hypothetical protein SASPL_128938 [Salvia splendens]|uniref:PROP1-like PPR domain-containing protein n=1 Tax=Salvia splendens TaxID=180675 RepID=A0A8X8ZMI9_SALSN|nr:hypothetical protein SASPL_128938 [Salvia splendens]
MNEALEAYTNREIDQWMQRALQPAVPRPRPVVHLRAVIDRDHVAAHQRLYEDYFAQEPRFNANLFRHHFRMSRSLFMRIVNALEQRYLYFRFRHDASGRLDHTPIQKCTAAIRQLAYGGATDMWDEYLHIGETTTMECMKYFCQGVIEIFSDQYLRSPTPEDCRDLLRMHEEQHGFPGMLGSIDCMHWEWKNIPASWKGFYTTGYKGKNPTMILEAVADYRLWIWHAYFGIAGSNNDLNVLNSSPLFNEQCQGVGPAISFVANGNRHDVGYYLADEIYPRWPVFVKTIRCASDERKTYFAARQKSARKDSYGRGGLHGSSYGWVIYGLGYGWAIYDVAGGYLVLMMWQKEFVARLWLGYCWAIPIVDDLRTKEKSMESSLSLAPQAISLITCSPVFSPLSSRAVGLLRIDCRRGRGDQMQEETDKVDLTARNVIYHSRFFDVCKRQKAVKVAFRFARLIRNPTLSTFNMLMSVCASSQDSEGAFQILQLVQEAALNADCKLYTTLISTCAKSGKVDTMFKVFHEMVNGGVEPNLHTYGALIDGCAKAGQVAKAFGAYGILRSKNVKPDRVVFNALITACGQSGAVDRAFDVLAEMRAELQPIDPDHVTVGALMKACASAGQIDRAREVYNMIHQYDIRGTAELYTIAVNSCSHRGDWEFACSVYDDMIQKGGAPDEMFISALIDVAGHAGKVDAAFEILQEARAKGMHVGIISYSSLMGACSKARDWQKALELYEDIKRSTLKPGVSLMNALITALCDADQLQKALEILSEMKSTGVCPNIITYSVLLVASEKKDDLEAGLKLFSQAKQDSVALNLVICRCLIAMCLRRFQADCSAGEPVLSFTSGHVQLNSKWTSLALMVYRETIVAGVAPRMDELSLVLGCLKLPHDTSVRNRLIENLGYNSGPSKGANVCSLINGFGEYDPRAFSLVEEATSLGVIPLTSMKDSLIVVDLRNFLVHTAAVYLLTVLKGLKHRLAAGVKAPNLNILLPVEKAQIQTSAGETEINMAGRVSQEVAALLRRLGLSYQGNGSYGKIRINGITIRKWFQPKLGSPFTEKKMELSSSLTNLASGINRQRRKIRTVHL